MAGRALAGGFGPPAWIGAGLARDLGDGLGHGKRGVGVNPDLRGAVLFALTAN